jgi:hypothetical protein
VAAWFWLTVLGVVIWQCWTTDIGKKFIQTLCRNLPHSARYWKYLCSSPRCQLTHFINCVDHVGAGICPISFACPGPRSPAGSPIYRPVNCALTWISSRPMQLCGYCPVHPASPRKQPQLWACWSTQHSCLYPNLFVHLKCNCAAVYVGNIYCSVLFCCSSQISD